MKSGYKFGEHVVFHDDNQCEVRGVVVDEKDYPDRIILDIQLDDSAGRYMATLMKKRKA